MTDASHTLRRETEAARRLLSHLREQGVEDDAELAADAIEGETNLHEAIATVIEQIDECEVHEIGLKAKEEAFANRRAAIVARKERLAAAIEQALIAAEQDKVTLPTATVFISKRKAKVIVQNEADIPSEFFVEQERPAPKLDKRALQSALSDGREVPGAILDNGTVSLTIRRK